MISDSGFSKTVASWQRLLIAEKPSSVIAAEKLLNEACKDNDGLPTPEAIYQIILVAEKGDAPACIALAWFYLSAGRRESKFSQWMDGWDSLSRPERGLMEDRPLMLSSFPRAIAHVDGDAFFTSVEQAIHPAL